MQQIVQQSVVNFKCFGGGGAKWCFDWYRCILVYFSDGIDTIS